MGESPGVGGCNPSHFEVGVANAFHPQNSKIFQKFYCAPEPRITVSLKSCVCGWGSAPDPVHIRTNALAMPTSYTGILAIPLHASFLSLVHSGESINLGAPVRFLVWGPLSITSEPPLLDGNLPSNYRGPRNGFLIICGAPERRSGAFRLTFTTACTVEGRLARNIINT
jgi:hypothetical protein